MRKLNWKKLLLRIIATTLIVEFILRFGVDMGKKALYIENENCEYHLVPNQDFSRFHNNYSTNEYGMRSHKVLKSDKKRILLIGDSVINGGSRIDQEELVSYKLEEQLRSDYGDNVSVYNISAGSWGPENAYQFLINNVDFSYDVAILIFSSHDFNDNMHHRTVVGEQIAWPNQHPMTAITDAFGNYAWPRIKSFLGYKNDYLAGFDDSAINPGWSKFRSTFNQNSINYFVYLHPDKGELEAGSLDEQGIDLMQYLDSLEMPYISGIETEDLDGYTDNIHVNSSSHEKMAETLFKEIMNRNLLNE
ncbi:MAG: hypothetical protein MK105_16260 [Crocinitomicaceae bacterium]|nr:hypothetical protein [Crocinitomicaceae bacterium]